MWTRIARHEWRTLSAERTPWIVLVLLALSIGYGVFNGLEWIRFQQSSIDKALTEERLRLDNLRQQVREIEAGTRKAGFTDPRAPDAVGGRLGQRYAAMPPSTFAALSVGQSDVLPYYFKISTASKESILTTNEIENPNRLLSGRFDLSFVVIYLYPLLILALSYNVLSSEKEDGTLALLLSQPISLKTCMAGKIGMRAMLFVLVVILLSVIAMAIGGIDFAAPGSAARLGMWTLLLAAYGAFWFGAVLVVTSFGRGSATNALALAGIWLFLVVVIPSLLNLATTTVYPMPSRVELVTALRAASKEASNKGSTLLAKYYEDHPELAQLNEDPDKTKNDLAVTELAIDEQIEQRVRPVVDLYDQQLVRQQALVDNFRFLSPAIIAQEALNDIAGTGAARHRHFVALVNLYHQQWRAFFLPMIVKKETFSAATYDHLPQFQFEDEPLSSVMSRTILATSVLAALAVILGVFGLWRLKDYPIAN